MLCARLVPNIKFIKASSSFPKCSLTPRMRLHLQWLWVTTCHLCAWTPIRSIFGSALLHLGGAIAIGFLAAAVVRDALLPNCKVTDLVPEGAVSWTSFKRQ